MASGVQATAEGQGLLFLPQGQGGDGRDAGSRRTETKDGTIMSLPSPYLLSISLSMTWLLYPFVLGNMVTGAYKFDTFESHG